MKKVVDSENEEVKSTSNWLWIALGVLVLIVIIFVIAKIAVGDKEFELNTFKFEKTRCTTNDFCWSTVVITNVAQHPVSFYTDPRKVDIEVDPEAIRKSLRMTQIPNGKFYLAFEEPIEGQGVKGEVGSAVLQVARITGDRLFNVETKAVLYPDDITCAAANDQTAVVLFTQGSENAVRLADNGCIMITATSEDDIIMVAEVYTMHLLGILWNSPNLVQSGSGS